MNKPPGQFWLPSKLAGKMNLQSGPKNYDFARVCGNGHLINDACKAAPNDTKPYCADCGAVGLDTCPECKQRIQGARIEIKDGIARRIMGQHLRRPPLVCHACEKPYPWTTSRLDTARDLISSMNEIPAANRELMMSLLPHLLRESPDAEIAAAKFQNQLRPASAESKESLKTIVWGLIKEGVKRTLFP